MSSRHSSLTRARLLWAVPLATALAAAGIAVPIAAADTGAATGTAVTVSPVAGAAAARAQHGSRAKPHRAPDALKVRAVRTGTKAAPIVVRVELPRDARLTAWVNGRRASAAFHHVSARVRVAKLAPVEGVHGGRNAIRLRADLPDGRYDRELRFARLPREERIANAGRDTSAIVGRPTEIGPEPASEAPAGDEPVAETPAAGGGHAGEGGADDPSTHWTIVSAPPGSDAGLAEDADGEPLLTPDRPGTYVLRASVGSGGDATHDTLTLTVRPNDPPLGVQIETLSQHADAAVWIDNRKVDWTYDRNGIFVVVLERTTRAVVDSATTPRHGGGLRLLNEIAQRWHDRGAGRYLMIVSGPRGIDRNAGDRALFEQLLGRLGIEKPSEAEWKALIENDAPFTLAGMPDGVEGSGTSLIPLGAGSGVERGNLHGWLQLNQSTTDTVSTKRYDLVSQDQLTLETSVGKNMPRTNTMRFGGWEQDVSLPIGMTAGFQVTLVDSMTKAVISSNAIATNGNGDPTVNEMRQRGLANELKRIADQPGQPLLLLQSIGKPRAASAAWNDVAEQLARFGATRWTVNALDGTHDYALVGRVGSAAPALEASDLTGERGRLTGVVARDRRWRLQPTVGDTTDTLNTRLIDTAYQAPVAFPPFDTPGKRAAEAWIVQSLHLCNPGGSCQMRPLYYENYGATNWTQMSQDLNRLAWVDGRGFSSAEFREVSDQLATELSAVSQIQHYFEYLQKPFARTQGKSLLELQELGDSLTSEFGTPRDQVASIWSLDLAEKLLGQLDLTEEGSRIVGAMTALMGLASSLSGQDGRPLLADQIRVRVSELGNALYTRYDLAQRAATGTALLFVSDWGKMQVARDNVNTNWKLPATVDASLPAMRLAAKRWFAESLVPLTFPYLLAATPAGHGGPGDPNQTTCDMNDKWAGRWFQSQTWKGLADNVQTPIVRGFDGDGRPIRTIVWMTRTFETWPSAGIGTRLFGDVEKGNLGLERRAFLTPALWGGTWRTANHRARWCDLPIR